MTALAKASTGAALGRQHETGYFTREQIDVLKNVLCPGLTDAELGLVAEQSKQTGLSPFLKQLHVTKRPTWDPDTRTRIPKLTIQIGIDGYRLTAERSGKYLGQRPFEWCGRDGKWRDIWLENEPPAAARATVLKAGCEPFVVTARYAAYVQTKQDGSPNSMWAKMGAEQLAKCAEALAFRKALPMELGGTYTQEEMGQAENETELRAEVIEAPPRAPQPPPAAPKAPALPTRTSKNYAVKAEADKPFTELSDAALAAYLAYYTERMEQAGPTLQAQHKAAISATIKAAEAELQRRLDVEGQPLPEDDSAEGEPSGPPDDYDPETGEVLDHPPADHPGTDDLAPLLEKSVEMAQQGVDWGNRNESWGLEGADAPANQTGAKRSRKGAA